MFTVLVVLLVAFLVYVGGGNGEWGVVAVAVVLGLLLLGLISGAKQENRAYGNFVDYWAKGGPESNRRHQSNRRR